MRKHGADNGHNSRAFSLRVKKGRKAAKTAKAARKKNR